jgi:hypothetical protein
LTLSVLNKENYPQNKAIAAIALFHRKTVSQTKNHLVVRSLGVELEA